MSTLLVWVVAIDSIGGYLLGNIREYDGRGGVSTGTCVGVFIVGNVAVTEN